MPPPASNEGVPRWVLLFGLVTIALCFGVAYHWGSLGEDEASLENIKIMEHRVDLVLSEAKKCVKDRTSIFAAAAKRNKNANDTRYASLKAKQLAYEALLQEEAAIHANASICLDAVRHLNVKLEQDEETAPERMRQLNRLNAQTRDVTDQIAALKKGDKGMRRNLLLESLRQAREKHLHLAEALGEQVNMDDDYDNEILQQYKPKQRNITASDIVRLTSNSTAAMSIQKFIDRWSNFTFNASVHTKVFIPANNGPDTNETIERPKWFDREGAAPEVLGTVIGNLSAPITTTAFAIKSLTTVALCAFRNNNSNLTFPNRFRRVDSRHKVELLNNTVESPLVTFCRQCVSTVSQPVFRLACGRDKPNRLYGTYDFWAARSMIRPTPAVVDAARVKFNQLGLSGRNVLGVAYKKSPQLALKCQHQRKPQRHYMWARALANRSNDTLFEAVPGMNQTEQCQPTIATLFTAVDALRQKFKFDAVLISVQTAEEEKIVMNTEFGGAMQVVAIRPNTGFEDMAELLITSWANHILVNRYSDHSQVLTEMFALRNGIRANRIHFF